MATLTFTVEYDPEYNISEILDDPDYKLREGITRDNIAKWLIAAKREEIRHDMEQAADRHKRFGDWYEVCQEAKHDFCEPAEETE